MTNRAPRYRCLTCAMDARVLPNHGPRATEEVAQRRERLEGTVIRRPGSHHNHRHPGRPHRFEAAA